MDSRFIQINKELEEMSDGKLGKYGMKPVDYQIILILTRKLIANKKALTFHANMVEYFKNHGFTVTSHVDGVNWLIVV